VLDTFVLAKSNMGRREYLKLIDGFLLLDVLD
jgi:hypothetical protein